MSESAPQAQDAPRPQQELQTQEAVVKQTFADAAAQLRAPFTPEAIRFKVQTVIKPRRGEEVARGAVLVAYIDARLVIERLNAVVPGSWQDSYFRVEGQPNYLVCRLKVGELVREDVGYWRSGFGKEVYSDALKRAAVHFGIGVSVYATPQVTLWTPEAISKGFLKSVPGKDGPSLALTDKGERGLRGGYRAWLLEHGVKVFGNPLDHGDVEDSGAMDTADAGPTPVEAAEEPRPQRVEGPEADDLISRVQQAYDELVGAKGRGELPPAAFRAKLEATWGSLEGLEALLSELERMTGASA